jgi:hypothetical protein
VRNAQSSYRIERFLYPRRTVLWSVPVSPFAMLLQTKEPVTYFGVVVGRVANRIANAQFQLNGKVWGAQYTCLRCVGLQEWKRQVQSAALPIIGLDCTCYLSC